MSPASALPSWLKIRVIRIKIREGFRPNIFLASSSGRRHYLIHNY